MIAAIQKDAFHALVGILSAWYNCYIKLTKIIFILCNILYQNARKLQLFHFF